MDDDSLDVMTVEDAMGSLAIDEDVSVNEELIGLDVVMDEDMLETTLDSNWLETLVMELEAMKLSLEALMNSEVVTIKDEAVTLLDEGAG